MLVPLTQHAAAAKSLQSCPTLCDPTVGSPPGSAIPGILQARTLEWVAISFSDAWKWKVKVKLLSRVRLLATPWTAAYQAPSSMGFSSKSTGVGYHCLLPQTSLKASNLSVTNSDKSAARALSTSSNEWGETGDTYSGFVSFPPPLNSQSKIKTNEKRERIE